MSETLARVCYISTHTHSYTCAHACKHTSSPSSFTTYYSSFCAKKEIDKCVSNSHFHIWSGGTSRNRGGIWTFYPDEDFDTTGADYAALPASYKASVCLFLESFFYQLHRKKRPGRFQTNVLLSSITGTEGWYATRIENFPFLLFWVLVL